MARQGSARQRVARLDKARAARLRILTSPLPGAFASTRCGRNRHGITRHGNARRGVALQREAREFAVGSDLWALPGGNTNTARQGLAARGVARRGAATRGKGVCSGKRLMGVSRWKHQHGTARQRGAWHGMARHGKARVYRVGDWRQSLSQ